MGITVFGSVLVSAVFANRRFCRLINHRRTEDIVFASRRFVSAYVKPTIVQHDQRRVRLMHVVQPDKPSALKSMKALMLLLSTNATLLDRIHSHFKVKTTAEMLKSLNDYVPMLYNTFVLDSKKKF